MSEHLPEPAPRELPVSLRLAGRVVPGIARVHDQAAAFVDAWQRSNEGPGQRTGPSGSLSGTP